FYRRDLKETGGGRVTELVARPLLNLFYPGLAGLIQPLAGEMAARRETVLDLPFFTGYGVEIGLLIDLAERYGIGAIAQADLGTRHHRSRELAALGGAAHQIIRTVLTRLDEGGRVKLADELPQTLLRFDPATHAARAIEEPLDERPPLRTILESP
ncbi:MAG: glucosyl-3-phosphoglycerate synthase, partial [Actinomycetota bacterium]|nr:glucosyl-3-phosphoglycerate synthase [Actinomycetota bacterium]